MWETSTAISTPTETKIFKEAFGSIQVSSAEEKGETASLG